MRLTTPNAYVNQYGVTETGRLLTNKGTISPGGDDRSDYVGVLFVGGSEANALLDAVKTELNLYIDAAQDLIVPEIRRFLVWPLERDGFQINTSDTPHELAHITREVARWLLHDEDANRHIEDVSVIERRYKNALMTAKRIGDGRYRLSDVDSKYDDNAPVWVI